MPGASDNNWPWYGMGELLTAGQGLVLGGIWEWGPLGLVCGPLNCVEGQCLGGGCA